MKLVIASLFLALLYPSLGLAQRYDVITREDARRFGLAVIRGSGFFCVMAEKETKCFAEKSHGFSNPVISLGNPEWISARPKVFCIGYKNDARCTYHIDWAWKNWNDSEASQKLFNSHQSTWVSTGIWTPETLYQDKVGTCYLQDSVVTCSGSYRATKTSHVTRMAAGWGFLCTVEQKELVCRAQADTAFKRSVSYGGSTPDVLPDMKVRVRDPKLLVAGWHHACAWAMDQLTCFGLNDKGQTNAPALRGVTELMADEDFTCAQHSAGTSCWGDVPENLKNVNPFGLVVKGTRNSCLTKGQTIDCSAYELDFTFETWEAFNGFLQEQFIRLPSFQFRFQSLESDLREVARAGYSPKNQFLKTIADFLQSRAPVAPKEQAYILSFKNASARLLAMMALEPIVREIGVRNDSLTSEYSAALAKVKTGMSLETMAQIDRFPIVHRMAQTLIREGLRSLRVSVGASADNEALGKLVGELAELEIRLGQTPTDADIEATSQEYKSRLTREQPLLSRLMRHTRGRSFLEMALEVAAFLK